MFPKDFSPTAKDLILRILKIDPYKEISDTNFKGYIACKQYNTQMIPPYSHSTSAFFLREQAQDSNQRGFIVRDGNSTRARFLKEYFYPLDGKERTQFSILGQLIVARNPFSLKNWIIIISGISGPASLGIAQMLTGCVNNEFTINQVAEGEKTEVIEALKLQPEAKNGNDINYDFLSDRMLEKLLTTMKASNGEVNAIVQVEVYFPEKKNYALWYDERKIISWSFPDLCLQTWANPNNLTCRL